MAKIGILADIHVKPDTLTDFTGPFNKAIEDIKAKGCEHLLIAGDVWHKYNISGREASVGSIFMAIAMPINAAAFKSVTIIDGNHDAPTSIQGSANLVLAAMPNTKTVSQYEWELDDSIIKRIDNVSVITMPWINNTTHEDRVAIMKFINLIADKEIAAGQQVILLGHCEVDGIQLINNYTLFGNKFNFPQEFFNELIAKGVTLALGHIHNRSKFYLGSFNQISFGDEDIVPGYHIYDSDLKSLMFYENTLSKRYKTININSKEELDALSDKHLDPASFYYKLKVHYKPEISSVKAWQAMNVVVEDVSRPVVAKRCGEEVKAMSAIELVKKYFDDKGLAAAYRDECIDKLKGIMQ